MINGFSFHFDYVANLLRNSLVDQAEIVPS